ncbi:DUF1491 family protein [Thalassospira lucentensis]|jgi:hypothetical protein|uniref:DUF1491 family protein n=1 Tax=Thalassospira lucentensis TaxID=168935 RepID=UPI003D2D0355|tara:strand:- start:788 stop:1138 length:351 start_codon:yes stop_codon:yes gene_type:complete
MQPRLKAGLWVRGQIAICQSSSIIAMIAHMGNEDAGAVLVKLNRFANGCFVYSRVTTLDGDMGWMQVAGGPDGGRETEFACDEYWRKQVAFDRDVWVLEVEDHKGEYELDAPIVDF